MDLIQRIDYDLLNDLIIENPNILDTETNLVPRIRNSYSFFESVTIDSSCVYLVLYFRENDNITDSQLNIISISEIFTYTITKNSTEKSESESTLEIINYKLSPEDKIQKVYTPIFPYFIDLSNETNSNYNPFILEPGRYSVLVNYLFNLDHDTVVTDSVPFSFEIVSPFKKILINMYDLIFK